jgi:peptidoglycan/LPS O-acetylase OafA/YrhL
MKSWKTTAAGIAAIVAALATAVGALFDADPVTMPDWGAVAAAVMAGVGLIAARDNGVTSEQAGAK